MHRVIDGFMIQGDSPFLRHCRHIIRRRSADNVFSRVTSRCCPVSVLTFSMFVRAGGDFTKRNGSGGESIYGRPFEDEDLSMPVDEAGLLVMANKGPNTNGCVCFTVTRLTYICFIRLNDPFLLSHSVQQLAILHYPHPMSPSQWKARSLRSCRWPKFYASHRTNSQDSC